MRGLPGGKRLFSRLIGSQAPYSGSIRAVVRDLEPGRAVVALSDRRSVRNHLNSIHAVALTNLGELASGLAMVTDLPPGSRAIVTGLDIEFTKKARGSLIATGTATAPSLVDIEQDPVTCVALAEIRDSEGDVVATFEAEWRVGLRENTVGTPLPGAGVSG